MDDHREIDLGSLTAPVPYREWRQFRREARAGRHGSDLADAGFVERHAPFWRVRARRRFRLHRFAAANGIIHEADAGARRRAGAYFDGLNDTRHLDWCGIPGPTGFEVANHRTRVETDDDVSIVRTTYAVFTLRATYPRTIISTRQRAPRWSPKRLHVLDPVPLPGGGWLRSAKPHHPDLLALVNPDLMKALCAVRPRLVLEIVGNELFMYTSRQVDLASSATWQMLLDIRSLLSERLARPPNVSELRIRERSGEQLALGPGGATRRPLP